MSRQILLWVFAFLLLVPGVCAREFKGLEIPEIMETPAGVLVLNGAGERHIFAESVYIAALYLKQPEKNWREVVEKRAPMAIRLQVTQAFFATSTRIRNTIEKGFQNNLPDGDVTPIKEKMQAFMDCFKGEIHTGDVFVIRYIPDQGTMVLKNDAFQGVMPGHGFKETVFGIWLGKEPAQASLKQRLLAADVSEEALALRKAKQITAEEKKKKQPAEASEPDKGKAAGAVNQEAAATDK
ncbi:MAG: chalcone isomerase family protein, partial [Thermodesulfobacteriota bacterium]